MFVPLHDENTLKSIRLPLITWGLIAINIAVFLLEQAGMDNAAIASFALIPGELLTPAAALGVDAPETQSVPETMTLITYMFFHASWLHLIGNMLFLWVFGDNVEDSMGHIRFLGFYLLCGIIAGLVHAFVVSAGSATIAPDVAAVVDTEAIPLSAAPLIGASGAVAGVIAAYLMLHPRVMVWVLALKVLPLRIYAFYALGAWVLMQVLMVLIPQSGPVAWWAHIGGLAAGAVLILFMRRPGVKLFDKALGSA